MKIVLLAIPVLFMLPVSPVRAQSNEDLLKKRFLSEYPEALKAWEARTSKVEGTLKYTDDATTKEATSHKEVLFSFKCKLPDMMVVTSTWNNTEGQREQSVNGINKDYSFSLKKLGEVPDFVVKSLEAVSGSDRALGNSPISKLRPFLWVPYASTVPHARLLSNPRFAVRRVSTLDRNGRSLFKVEFDFLGAPPNEGRTKSASDSRGAGSFFLVSPEEKWVLYEYEWRRKKGVSETLEKGVVEYQGTLDGFPIVKRATRQSLKLPERDVVLTYTYDFLDFRLVDVPDKEFTLAAFGVPEASSQPAKVVRSRGLGYWLLALAMVALAAAVYFKMAASRRKPSFSS